MISHVIIKDLTAPTEGLPFVSDSNPKFVSIIIFFTEAHRFRQQSISCSVLRFGCSDDSGISPWLIADLINVIFVVYIRSVPMINFL
jgi:hypothetical protein